MFVLHKDTLFRYFITKKFDIIAVLQFFSEGIEIALELW